MEHRANFEPCSDCPVLDRTRSIHLHDQMTQSSPVYAVLFKRQEIYTFSKTTGPTGGLLYYELAAMRPDWVLSDLISILHPELMEQGHQTNFFKPLDP